MTRDDLIAWLLLPWNIAKAIVLTAYWIIAALIRGGDEEEELFVAPGPAPDARAAGRERSTEAAGAGAAGASASASAEQRTPS